MKRSNAKENVLAFGHREDKTSCIALNLLKMENQLSGEAIKERMSVDKP